MINFDNIISQFEKRNIIKLEDNGQYDQKLIGKTFYSDRNDGEFITITSTKKSNTVPVSLFKIVFDKMMATIKEKEHDLDDISTFKTSVQDSIQISIDRLNDLIDKKGQDAELIEKNVKDEIKKVLGNKLKAIEDILDSKLKNIEEELINKVDIDIKEIIKDKLDEIAKPTYSIREHMFIHGKPPTLEERVELSKHYNIVTGIILN